ncbi:MAG: hypothetical protein PHE03_04815 [Bacteroidales bacterium]|nr:hypothetical protein [Bacteroidales bacterium]MDD3891606.1 hypothetical protein [Bacteroidales bacterium]
MITIDWIIICLCLEVSLAIGFSMSKRAGRNTSIFLSGKKLLWCIVNASNNLFIVSVVEAQVIIMSLLKRGWNKFMKLRISIPL